MQLLVAQRAKATAANIGYDMFDGLSSKEGSIQTQGKKVKCKNEDRKRETLFFICFFWVRFAFLFSQIAAATSVLLPLHPFFHLPPPLAPRPHALGRTIAEAQTFTLIDFLDFFLTSTKAKIQEGYFEHKQETRKRRGISREPFRFGKDTRISPDTRYPRKVPQGRKQYPRSHFIL
jgi:hypothetical protein